MPFLQVIKWLEAHGYSRLVVYRRLPLLFHFAEFAQKKGCGDIASCKAYIKEFKSLWLEQHGAKAKTAVAARKHAMRSWRVRRGTLLSILWRELSQEQSSTILKHGRPKTEDRHLFFRIFAPRAPIERWPLLQPAFLLSSQRRFHRAEVMVGAKMGNC